MNEALVLIDEVLRMPAPCPSPFTLACDGPCLWIGSAATNRIYGVDARNGRVFEEAQAPGRMYGACVTGDALRVIVADDDDNRWVRRYIFGKDFKRETLPCPEATGSFLAYDGDLLFVSQRFDQRIIEIDPTGKAKRTIPTPRQVTGMTIVNGMFYLITTESEDSDDYRLQRLDAHHHVPVVRDLAALPFAARSLAFDGARFWTVIRGENTIVAFAKPD